MVTGVKDLRNKAELDVAVKEGGNIILHFWASWCQASAQMDAVFAELCTDSPHTRFFRVEAEEQPEISEAFGVSAVPLFIFIKDSIVLDRLEGANPAVLANKAARLAGPPSIDKAAAPASLGLAAGPTVLETVKDLAKETGGAQNGIVTSTLSDTLEHRLQQLVNSSPVMLFMKGTPEHPRCGFSRKVVDALNELGVKFGSFDILSDDDIRHGLKIFSNWPTFPQLYCKGELLGGCDITLEMHRSGDLKDTFLEKGVLSSKGVKHAAESVTASCNEHAPIIADKPEVTDVGHVSEANNADGKLDESLRIRLNVLINSKPIMLFMKGTPEEPRCSFSRKVVEVLKEEEVEFDSFDILSDDDVRQRLKTLSNWPSYPQLYVKGEFIGGCDVLLDMHKNGELKRVFIEKEVLLVESVQGSKESLESRLKNLINSSPTVLFMKGTPDSPRCKFSSKVVAALRQEGVKFGSVDILNDEEVRQGLKTFSNWPTFPQLYHHGELIGGCDIVLDMQKSGELKTMLTS